MFKKIDTGEDGKIQISELKDLTIEFWNFGRMKCEIDELAKEFLEEFDGDNDKALTEEEFGEGVTKMLKQYKFKFDSVQDEKENLNVSIYHFNYE